jgi:hypothetical protein
MASDLSKSVRGIAVRIAFPTDLLEVPDEMFTARKCIVEAGYVRSTSLPSSVYAHCVRLTAIPASGSAIRLINGGLVQMKEQFAASKEVYPEFDVVAVWREVLRPSATEYTRSLGPEKLLQMPLFLAELQRGISRKRLSAFRKRGRSWLS